MAGFPLVGELRDYIDDDIGEHEPKLTSALDAAVDAIQSSQGCNRRFTKDTVATPRQFRSRTARLLYIDDAVSITSVKTDLSDTGTFDQTWADLDWDPEPLNGTGPNGMPGWPITALRSVGASLWFPYYGYRARVEVTAVWGWPSVPAAIYQATLQLADRLFKLHRAGLGVVAGDDQFGAIRVARQIAGWGDLIAPYCAYGANGVLVG